jgi:hypothetical protein
MSMNVSGSDYRETNHTHLYNATFGVGNKLCGL